MINFQGNMCSDKSGFWFLDFKIREKALAIKAFSREKPTFTFLMEANFNGSN